MRKWHFHNTRLSADRGDISVLAICETLIAISVYVWIVIAFDTFLHIAAAACIAPTLLLQSKRSQLIGQLIAANISNRMDSIIRRMRFFLAPRKVAEDINSGIRKYGPLSLAGRHILSVLKGILLSLIYPLLLIIIFTIAKIAATFFVLGTRPLKTISLIPVNWRKFVFSIDISIIPEALPGIERSNRVANKLEHSLRFSTIVNAAKHFVYRRGKINIYVTIASIIIFTVLFLPSIIYRFSIKGTSIVLSPLLWISSKVATVREIRYVLLINRYDILSIIVVIYSAFVIISFFIRIYFTFALDNMEVVAFSENWINLFVSIDVIPVWQIAAAVNGILAIVLFLRSQRHLIAIEAKRDEEINFKYISYEISTIQVIRSIMTLYIIICLFYITWKVAIDLEWPAMEFVMFPWGRPD